MSKIGRFYLLLCWAFVVFILVSFPMPEYEGTKITLYDKVAHAFLFGIFSYLVVWSLIPFRGGKFKLSYIIYIGFLLGTFYSGFSEYIQMHVPGRTVSEYDFLGGLLGIIIAMIISYVRFKKK